MFLVESLTVGSLVEHVDVTLVATVNGQNKWMRPLKVRIDRILHNRTNFLAKKIHKHIFN